LYLVVDIANKPYVHLYKCHSKSTTSTSKFKKKINVAPLPDSTADCWDGREDPSPSPLLAYICPICWTLPILKLCPCPLHKRLLSSDLALSIIEEVSPG